MPDQSKTSPEHTIEVALDTAEAATSAGRETASKGQPPVAEAEKRRAEMAKAARLPDKPHNP